MTRVIEFIILVGCIIAACCFIASLINKKDKDSK